MNLPNKLTMLRMILVPFFIAALYLTRVAKWWAYVAVVIFVVASLTDMLDGRIARSRGLVTDFGKLMDPMADKLLTCTAFIMLTGLGYLGVVFTVLFIARELIISAFRLAALEKRVVIAAEKLGKYKTIMQMVSIIGLMLAIPEAPWQHVLTIIAQVCVHVALVLTYVSLGSYLIKNKGVISTK